MATTLEDLSVELFYEVFTYFQFHEVFNIFSTLNSRFAVMINNMPLTSVYLGLNGMSISVTEFYYTRLSQLNNCTRLISLCISDTLSITNGLWLSSYLSTFVNLRHLSLIDIKRSSFELILNSPSPINSLIVFSVRFSNLWRASFSYIGIPEGAYYERIFYLFPSLRLCHLLFYPYTHYTPDSQFVLPPDRIFMPIEVSLLNVQSLTIQCSPSLLSYLFEYLPKLERLYYIQTGSWLPTTHPLIRNDIFSKDSSVSLSETSSVLSGMFQQLKGPVPIELELCLEENMYRIRAVTLPKMDKNLCAHFYLHNTVHSQSRWPYNRPVLKNLHFRPIHGPEFDVEDENLINLFNDVSLCNKIMSNGLRQLNLFTGWNQPNLIKTAYLIVERLPDLHVLELHGGDELIEMSLILIEGLKKLNFLALRCGLVDEKLYETRLRNSQSLNTRLLKTEFFKMNCEDTLFVWL
ncbi:hypothetical protein I4U23_030927 [Adineta vaga]|nr:hypothetical protein I4U23_030927 [Adineta vaga]